MRCVWEHNGNDTLLYSVDLVGAYTRGENLTEAIDKMRAEVNAYLLWAEKAQITFNGIEIVQDKECSLHIADADSDVIFNSERDCLTLEEYRELKALVMKSAHDFHRLYCAIPDKNRSCLPRRKTFYGYVPRTAREMYDHTKCVNTYYFGEIDVNADNEGTIFNCRARGFEQLEKVENFLANPVVEGSYGELWSLRKVLRRFLWHDRIHAKAMYRMAVKTFGEQTIPNIFCF